MTEAWSPHLIQTITAGEWTVHAVADARFRADGGIAFSMVPRSLWEREVTVIDGTIPLRVGVLLAERPGVRLVVDTGLGERGVDRAIRGFFGDLTATGGLSRALAELDWAPDSVTHLVLTHLHIDHAGGAFHDGGEPRFPRARTIVSRRELSYALDPHPLRGPVFDTRAARLLSKLDNLAPVDTLITEVGPGLQVIGLGGHTPGLIGVRLGSAEETVIVPGDLLPTRAHRRPRWVLSYDQDPSSVFDGRRRLVSRAMALGWIVHFGHDPSVAFGRFRPGGDVEVVPAGGRGLAVA